MLHAEGETATKDNKEGVIDGFCFYSRFRVFAEGREREAEAKG